MNVDPMIRAQFDICECGDFRRQHTENGCRLCQPDNFTGRYCKAFRFAWESSDREVQRMVELDARVLVA